MIHAVLVPLLVVSASYLGAFLLTEHLVMPVQRLILPDVSAWASLVFLPHGVRVLTAWLFGWWSILLLAPSALFTVFLLYGFSDISIWQGLSFVPGVLAAATAFALAAWVGRDLRFGVGKPAQWREVLAVGVLASLFNSAGTMLVRGEKPMVTLVCLLGDIIGLVACLALLMQAFRWARLWKGA